MQHGSHTVSAFQLASRDYRVGMETLVTDLGDDLVKTRTSHIPPPPLLIIPQRRRPKSSRGLDGPHIHTLGTTVQSVTYEGPVDHVGGVVDGETGEEFEGRGAEVVALAGNVGYGWVWVHTGEDWVAVGLGCVHGGGRGDGRSGREGMEECRVK
jgi:hypothetical protein